MDLETHQRICTTYWDIWNRCQSDREYARLMEDMKELEPLYISILTVLSRECREVIDDYLCYRETMSRRMLEFACERLLFPDEVQENPGASCQTGDEGI